MTAPDDEAWLTALLERRPPSTPDDFPARVLERLPGRERPWRRRLGLSAAWVTVAGACLWGADALSLGGATGTSSPLVAFCLGTALIWYLVDR